MRTNNGTLAATLSLTLLLSFSHAKAAEDLKICSGLSSFQNVIKPIAANFEERTGIHITIPNNLSRTGVIDNLNLLLAGKCEASAGSIDFDSLMRLMRENNTPVDRTRLTYQLLGRDNTKVIAHPKMKIPKINLLQLGSLYGGKIKNWKELGGPDLPIQLILSKAKVGTSRAFQNRILEGRNYSDKVRWVETWEDVVKEVSNTPGATGFVGENLSHKNAQVVLLTEDIGRPIILISIGKPSVRVQKLVEFIQSEARESLLN